MMKVVAIRHVAFEGLGSLAASIEQVGGEIWYHEAGVSNLKNLDPLEPDLLVVLGGPLGAYEDANYPFLIDEVGILQARLAADRPTLGICLGAQLMARALGAAVYPGPRKEIGWSPLTLSNTPQLPAFRYLDSSVTSVLHWHGDTFDLPTGATLLASTPGYRNQAFKYAKRALGLQFHPEILPADFERWLIGHACEIAGTPGISVNDLRKNTLEFGAQLHTQARHFWDEWLAEVLELQPQTVAA